LKKKKKKKKEIPSTVKDVKKTTAGGNM